jgi:hypothetical protein
MKFMPQRRNDLQVSHVGDEIMIYDPRKQNALCLNPLASQVFLLCDGMTPLAEAALKVSKAEFNLDLLRLTLAELAEQNLVEAAKDTFTRRAFLGRWGQIAVALPLIAAVSAPAAAQAKSGGLPP